VDYLTYSGVISERNGVMSDDAKCCECGTPVSYDTGFSLTGTLAEDSEHRVYCPQHAPNQGKGYTLADLQQWKHD
jgi:hypothetical protein